MTVREQRDEWIWNRAYFKWIEEGEPSGQNVRHYLEACREYDEMMAQRWDDAQREAREVIVISLDRGDTPRAAITAAVSRHFDVGSLVFRGDFLVVWLRNHDWRLVNFPEPIDWDVPTSRRHQFRLEFQRYSAKAR